jgi:hypothetical protein
MGVGGKSGTLVNTEGGAARTAAIGAGRAGGGLAAAVAVAVAAAVATGGAAGGAGTAGAALGSAVCAKGGVATSGSPLGCGKSGFIGVLALAGGGARDDATGAAEGADGTAGSTAGLAGSGAGGGGVFPNTVCVFGSWSSFASNSETKTPAPPARIMQNAGSSHPPRCGWASIAIASAT